MYNANYMDGVPVKIAEKYKPPPPIYKLPQPLAYKINLEDNFYWNCPAFSYNFELEKKAMSKTEQWKRIRQRNKELRRERILRKEQQRQREYEDRQKNLLYSVSYPSTDDLSSEEEEEKAVLDIELKENRMCMSESKETAPQIRAKETVNSFHNILQPTVLSSRSSPSTNSSQTFIIKSKLENKIPNSFNYKDFEDDTSSPFDNIELKTINDLDVLAQVLHNTQIKYPANEKSNKNEAAISYESTTTSVREQTKAENIPQHKINLPFFKYDFNSPQGTLTPSRYHHKANLPHSSLTPLHKFHGLNNSNNYYNYQPSHCKQSTNKVDSDSPESCDRQQVLTDDQVKSKSVPNILKELRDEIRKSEIRRYRNCSYNMEGTSQHSDICVMNKSEVEINYAHNGDSFSQLDSEAKRLVKQVSAMGFPFKRVARIVQLLGADDKKVLEHLIPLSELADLGFEESKISDALMRNENNKNKALDELIS